MSIQANFRFSHPNLEHTEHVQSLNDWLTVKDLFCGLAEVSSTLNLAELRGMYYCDAEGDWIAISLRPFTSRGEENLPTDVWRALMGLQYMGV